MTADEILDLATVIPVVVIDDADEAVALARGLVAAGMPAIEITLRTPAALTAIANIAKHVPEAHVGAGTVLNPHQGEQALDHGATFLVSPGSTKALLWRSAASSRSASCAVRPTGFSSRTGIWRAKAAWVNGT